MSGVVLAMSAARSPSSHAPQQRVVQLCEGRDMSEPQTEGTCVGSAIT